MLLLEVVPELWKLEIKEPEMAAENPDDRAGADEDGDEEDFSGIEVIWTRE